MADLEPARALAERIIGMLADHEGSPINSVAELAELLDQFAADVRESERQACIEYSDRTESMFLARAQAIADNSDRADAEAASDDEERHEMRAEGARVVAHGLRHAAHRAGVAAEVRREGAPASERLIEATLLGCIADLRAKRDHYRQLAADASSELRHTMSRDARTIHEAIEVLESRLSPNDCRACDGSGYAPDPNYTGQAQMIMPCRACHPAWWQQMETERRGYGDAHSFPARRPARGGKTHG